MRARNTTDISPIGVLMLDVKQVAASCGIGTSTVWKLVKLGTFPRPVYFGPKVARFKAEDIQKWVANLEPATPPPYGASERNCVSKTPLSVVLAGLLRLNYRDSNLKRPSLVAIIRSSH